MNIESKMKFINKVAEVNVLFNSALEATEKWQQDFLRQEYFRIRTELLNGIFELLEEKEND